jgi:hypothetical protein
MSETNDTSASYALLRNETAHLLRYDLASLSLTQSLYLDAVTMLRLEIDNLQGRVFAGEDVDLGRLTSALALLQKLLPAELKVDPASQEATRRTDNRDKLKALFEASFAAADAEKKSRVEELEAREARVQQLEAELEARAGAPPTVASTPSSPPALRVVEAAPQPPPNSDSEWLRWYRAGGDSGASTGRGIHQIPKTF